MAEPIDGLDKLPALYQLVAILGTLAIGTATWVWAKVRPVRRESDGGTVGDSIRLELTEMQAEIERAMREVLEAHRTAIETLIERNDKSSHDRISAYGVEMRAGIKSVEERMRMLELDVARGHRGARGGS